MRIGCETNAETVKEKACKSLAGIIKEKINRISGACLSME